MLRATGAQRLSVLKARIWWETTALNEQLACARYNALHLACILSASSSIK
jgi:hypothetical protein